MKELNLKSIVCVSNNSEAKKVSNFKLIKPDFIAIEPPELIGGENSVSSTKPEVIEKVVKICSGIPVLAGAGVKDNNDTKIALKLGCNGVLLSSHYVKSKDPEKFLIELIKDL
ncbi:MAG: hypothetical protein KatS3mg002_0857 [Candidatus Woesearchaeota archaeon]|nr:MAG: hypothetical protein KatS3mg002_0857 [Candidatus Woesearchaeota archaeon]